MNILKRWWLQRKINRYPYPDFIQDYYKKILEQEKNNTKTLDNTRFVVLDTETTGLDTRQDVVLSVGAIAIEAKAIKLNSILEITLQRTQKLEQKTVEIHGLTRRDMDEGETVEAAARQFIDFLGNAIIVAHHAEFDVRMMNKTVSEALGLPFELMNTYIDTANLAQRIDKNDNPYQINQKYDLDTLCQRYNIAMHDRHTAWGDAFITAKLFLVLARILDKKGAKTVAALAQ
jgi:DNA polymerase III subunit epsilon